MDSRLVYFLGGDGDREKFLDMLKKENHLYHLGYQIVVDQWNNISIEAEVGGDRKILGNMSSPNGFELTVNRKIKGKYSSLDDQVDNLIAIADAYPQKVSRSQLKGIVNPTLVDRHLTP